jgi:hypothetical protein
MKLCKSLAGRTRYKHLFTILLLNKVEAIVFQIPNLHKAVNVGCNPSFFAPKMISEANVRAGA